MNVFVFLAFFSYVLRHCNCLTSRSRHDSWYPKKGNGNLNDTERTKRAIIMQSLKLLSSHLFLTTWSLFFSFSSLFRNCVVVPYWIAPRSSVRPITSFSFKPPLPDLYKGFLIPSRDIHPEVGNCIDCRNVGKPSTFDAAYLRKPKVYTSH
jgi:hypothetical protein